MISPNVTLHDSSSTAIKTADDSDNTDSGNNGSIKESTSIISNSADGKTLLKSVGKVVCVGRNYAAHIAELNNATPTRPLLFIKPASSIVTTDSPINSVFYDVPQAKSYTAHYETELCLRIGCNIQNATVTEIMQMDAAIDAVTVGLDLTLRDMQTELKDQGHPWERAKCFAGACVLGAWIEDDTFRQDLTNNNFQLMINDALTQDGHTNQMITPIYELLSDISYAFGLQAGDVVMTGTPSGVGALQAHDELILKLGEHEWSIQVL